MTALKARYASRKKRGNALVLCIVLMFAALAVAIFALQFTRFLGSEQEQRSAIEAAALSAATDLSRIVIDDPAFGYISLLDDPPIGSGTAAGDNFYLPVTSINTLMATNRLMCIMADWIDDPILKQYAARDYQATLRAQERLLLACRTAIQPGATAQDMNGKTFSLYDDAVTAYKNNAVRMTGGKSSLMANSMQISLGYLETAVSNMQTPKPLGSYTQIASTQQDNGFYKAFINIPYNSNKYVFAATGNDTILVDNHKYKANLAGLPYDAPSIIKVEADQLYQALDGNGRASNNIIHAVACAQPACLIDQRAHSGALVVDFPDGLVPEVARPGDVLFNGQIIQSPVDRLRTALSSDAPPAIPTKTSLYAVQPPDHPLFGDVMRVAVYDWLRRSGPHTNVDQVMMMLNNGFDSKLGSAAQTHIFQIDAAGNIVDQVQPMVPGVTDCISNKQFYAVSGLPLHSSNGKVYDIFVKDYCYQAGKQQGGIHAGEPLPLSDSNITPASAVTPSDSLGQSNLSKRGFPTGSGVRQSYDQTCAAVDIEIRKR